MCLQDWRLGRLLNFSVKNVPADLTSGDIVQPNQQRVGLSMSFLDGQEADQSGGVLTWDQTLISVDGVRIMVVEPYVYNYKFDLLSHGLLVTKKWSFSQYILHANIAVVEWFLPEDVLASGIAQFKSEYAQWLKSAYRQNM